MHTTEHAAGDLQNFPGGRVQLPRLSRPAGTDEFDPGPHPSPPGASASTDSDPTRPSGGSPAQHRAVDGTFADYFSTESLFGASPAPEEEVDEDPDSPYTVLGLNRRASWEDVTRRHRLLVSQLHPDRYVGADDATRAAAEHRVRDVNEAYSRIRRERAPSRP